MKTLKKRRKSNQTDYLKRMKLLKSGVPRLIFRKTNRYIVAQYVTSKEAKDEVKLGLNSKALLGYGWPKEKESSLKSTTAAYLTGLLIGKTIIDKKLEVPVVDSGMIRNIRKNKLFGFIKGLKDSGLDIQCDEEFFPSEDRIQGKHLKEDFSKTFEDVKSKIGGKK